MGFGLRVIGFVETPLGLHIDLKSFFGGVFFCIVCVEGIDVNFPVNAIVRYCCIIGVAYQLLKVESHRINGKVIVSTSGILKVSNAIKHTHYTPLSRIKCNFGAELGLAR